MNAPRRIRTRKENRTDRIFLKLNEECVLKGYEDSRKFADIMLVICPSVITIYTGLAGWLLKDIIPPFPSFLFIIPSIFLVFPLLASIYVLKSKMLYASPDNPERIRSNYIAVIEWRDKWNWRAGLLFSIGIVTMFFFLILGTAFGSPKPVSDAETIIGIILHSPVQVT